jgi:hypothetical protein
MKGLQIVVSCSARDNETLIFMFGIKAVRFPKCSPDQSWIRALSLRQGYGSHVAGMTV